MITRKITAVTMIPPKVPPITPPIRTDFDTLFEVDGLDYPRLLVTVGT
jgi:hypothetical protein